MRSREVLMCRDRYALLSPFLFLNTQLPPTRSPLSKQVTASRASRRAFVAARPQAPAPITATRFGSEARLIRFSPGARCRRGGYTLFSSRERATSKRLRDRSTVGPWGWQGLGEGCNARAFRAGGGWRGPARLARLLR